MPVSKNWQVVAGSTAAGLAVALTAVALAGPWESGQRTAERVRAASREEKPAGAGGAGRPSQGPSGGRKGASAPVPAPQVLAAAVGPRGALPPGGSGLAGRLAPLLKDRALGPLTTGAVVDAATGEGVWGHREGTAAVPASTTKIATAVAALSLLGPDHRLTTGVVADGDDRVVLVGGGDPTLTARKSAGGGYAAASLRALADGTARALKARGARTVRLSYDTSLYSGPTVHPIGHNDNIAPVDALMADEGRADGKSWKGPVARVWDPAAKAAATFAGMLRDRGVKVTGAVDRRSAPEGHAADRLAVVRSAPLSDLVERMLTNSDNDIAEALARHTALAAGLPGSFSGGAKGISSALRELGVPLKGARFNDGSGLNRADRLTADQLARLLVLAGDPEYPELRPTLTGLPVAHFTGSLKERFTSDDAGGGLGVIRAKTGTLTGVNALAGTVVNADGRLVTFAFLTNGTTSPASAMRALDRLASAVAQCGCHG